MLKKILTCLYKDENVYTEYEKTNNKVISVLQRRSNITNPSQQEVIDSINKVMDSRLCMKDQQKLIEKTLVMCKSKKAKKEHDIFMWKQEKKMRFEIDHKDYINEWKEEVGKKSVTIEDKNILFRNKYKDVYNKNSATLITLDEFIETLQNEIGDILDTKRQLSDYLEILKRISY